MAGKNPYKGADSFTKAAKSAGYPARSVFKLEEIDRRTHLLKPGMRVLDLGAAPGSWTLYAAEKVGARGKVLAVDLNPLGTEVPPQVTVLTADALSLENGALSLYAPYDIVLSDMAPLTSGNRFADQARSYELFMKALAVAEELVKPGGAFVGKIFMSGDLPEARAAIRRAFTTERLIRPEGVRSVSFEIFAVGLGRKGGDARVPPAAESRMSVADLLAGNAGSAVASPPKLGDDGRRGGAPAPKGPTLALPKSAPAPKAETLEAPQTIQAPRKPEASQKTAKTAKTKTEAPAAAGSKKRTTKRGT